MIEPRRVEVTHQRIVIRKLPRTFDGFRIVQLSDIHHSPFLGVEEIAEAVYRANELKPDSDRAHRRLYFTLTRLY